MREWMKHVRQVDPYVPGEQPDQKNMIKLNTNESPYPPAPGVARAAKEFDTDSLRLYPSTTAELLVSELAEYYGFNSDQIFVGVGSDDVLAIAFMTFFNSDKPILFPEITYSFYSVWAELYKIPYERPKLDKNFNLVIEDYKQKNGGIIFPNPNAPTGVCESLDTVEEIIMSNQDVVVIIDEAYIDFGGKSALELVNQYDNVLVVQTFSKARSMAGIRIGYAIGSKELINAMNNVKFSFNSYTMNRTSIQLGVEAVRDKQYFEDTLAKVIQTREDAKVRLRELGFTFPDSKANFIFATHNRLKAEDIMSYLKERDIYVRHFKQPSIDNYLRISIGTDDEMEQLYKALEVIV